MTLLETEPGYFRPRVEEVLSKFFRLLIEHHYASSIATKRANVVSLVVPLFRTNHMDKSLHTQAHHGPKKLKNLPEETDLWPECRGPPTRLGSPSTGRQAWSVHGEVAQRPPQRRVGLPPREDPA